MSWLALPGETGVNWMIYDYLYCEPCCGWTNLMSDWYFTNHWPTPWRFEISHQRCWDDRFQIGLRHHWQRAGNDALRCQGGLCVEPNPSMHKYFEAYRPDGSGADHRSSDNPLHLHPWNFTWNPKMAHFSGAHGGSQPLPTFISWFSWFFPYFALLIGEKKHSYCWWLLSEQCAGYHHILCRDKRISYGARGDGICVGIRIQYWTHLVVHNWGWFIQVNPEVGYLISMGWTWLNKLEYTSQDPTFTRYIATLLPSVGRPSCELVKNCHLSEHANFRYSSNFSRHHIPIRWLDAGYSIRFGRLFGTKFPSIDFLWTRRSAWFRRFLVPKETWSQHLCRRVEPSATGGDVLPERSHRGPAGCWILPAELLSGEGWWGLPSGHLTVRYKGTSSEWIRMGHFPYVELPLWLGPFSEACGIIEVGIGYS